MSPKKVAILLPWLKMGGTNKIALNFIKDLSEYCDVTLILSQNTGELLSDLPDNITVIVDKMQGFKQLLKKDLKGIQIKNLWKDLKYYHRIRQGQDSIDNYKYIVDRNPIITEEEFDCAISYHGQSPERLLNLLYRMKSKKRIAWIHGEISFDEDKCARLQKYYQQVDHFFFVSNPTRDSFAKVFPCCQGKTTVYYNPINKQEIIEQSLETMNIEYDPSYFNILTVGRLSNEKGQTMVPEIVALLKQDGFKVRWYLMGDGDTKAQIEEKIKALQVQQDVYLLGTIYNPYPYIKNCDLYVQPSFTEGYSTTICEAGILGKAIIGTEPSGGIKDQITSGLDGEIVEATVDSLKKTIEHLINNRTIIRQYEQNILDKNFEGTGEIKKFLDYLAE